VPEVSGTIGRTPLTEHGSLLRIGGIVDRDMRAIANEIETRQVDGDVNEDELGYYI
jgi:hypothetical protein